ncbi:hypothetical protein Pelo_19228 [Pelomyxa schiedti]|nr:hypothetical protein Pelo_19228 [Pelomyxa schiedti]
MAQPPQQAQVTVARATPTTSTATATATATTTTSTSSGVFTLDDDPLANNGEDIHSPGNITKSNPTNLLNFDI